MFSSRSSSYSEHVNSPDVLSFETLLTSFLRLADSRLSDTQKQVLISCSKVLCCERLALTSLADVVSRNSGIPYSTVKWNLRTLVDMGLIVGGTQENRGCPARLTACAEVLVHYLAES